MVTMTQEAFNAYEQPLDTSWVSIQESQVSDPGTAISIPGYAVTDWIVATHR